jgi:DNA gyrase subunit A
MGRTASGVRAIRLKSADEISSLNLILKDNKKAKFLVVTANGFGKQTTLTYYKTQRRGGTGIKTCKVTDKTGVIIGAQIINEETELMALSSKGQIIRMPLSGIRVAGRATQGVRIMKLNSGDKLIGVVCF